MQNDEVYFKTRSGPARRLPRAGSRIDADPRASSLIPKAAFEIRAVEAFRAHPPAASYQPAADGTRPGIFYVNTYDLAHALRHGDPVAA